VDKLGNLRSLCRLHDNRFSETPTDESLVMVKTSNSSIRLLRSRDR
jgi:hypothetical protein